MLGFENIAFQVNKKVFMVFHKPQAKNFEALLCESFTPQGFWSSQIIPYSTLVYQILKVVEEYSNSKIFSTPNVQQMLYRAT